MNESNKVLFRSHYTFFQIFLFSFSLLPGFIFIILSIFNEINLKLNDIFIVFLFSVFIYITPFIFLCPTRLTVFANKSITIITTRLLTSIIHYPANSIEGHALDVRYYLKLGNIYFLRIKANNKIKVYKLYELSKNTIEGLMNLHYDELSIQEQNNDTFPIVKRSFSFLSLSNFIFIICWAYIFIKYFLMLTSN